MIGRRYVGRATGQHRNKRQRRFRVFVISGLVAAVLGLILIGVLILNPGSDRPPNVKESQTPSGVTPTSTPTPTHSPASKPSGSPSVTLRVRKTETPAPRKPEPSPKPSTTTPTTPPPLKVYIFFIRDTDEEVCSRYEDDDATWSSHPTSVKYYSRKDNQ